MTDCPFCEHTFLTPQNEHPLIHCMACGLIWLDFAQQRPPIYAQAEAAVLKWEANLALHQSAA